MNRDLVSRIAFAIQDETINRLHAQRLARAALSALRAGDEVGRDLVVRSSDATATATASTFVPLHASGSRTLAVDRIEVLERLDSDQLGRPPA